MPKDTPATSLRVGLDFPVTYQDNGQPASHSATQILKTTNNNETVTPPSIPLRVGWDFPPTYLPNGKPITTSNVTVIYNPVIPTYNPGSETAASYNKTFTPINSTTKENSHAENNKPEENGLSNIIPKP